MYRSLSNSEAYRYSQLRESCGMLPMHEAARYGNMSLLKSLISISDNVDCVDHFGKTPLYYAATAGKRDAYELLVQNGADASINGYSVHALNEVLDAAELEVLGKDSCLDDCSIL